MTSEGFQINNAASERTVKLSEGEYAMCHITGRLHGIVSVSGTPGQLKLQDLLQNPNGSYSVVGIIIGGRFCGWQGIVNWSSGSLHGVISVPGTKYLMKIKSAQNNGCGIIQITGTILKGKSAGREASMLWHTQVHRGEFCFLPIKRGKGRKMN